MHKKNKILTITAFIIYIIALSWAIIFKCNVIDSDLRFGYRILQFIPFKDILALSWRGFLIEVILNILAFVPLGILYSHLCENSNIIKAIVVGAIVSFLYEAFQYIAAFGTSDITDIIMNTTGAALGYIAYKSCFIKLSDKTHNVILIVFIIIGAILCMYGTINTIYSFDEYLQFIRSQQK